MRRKKKQSSAPRPNFPLNECLTTNILYYLLIQTEMKASLVSMFDLEHWKLLKEFCCSCCCCCCCYYPEIQLPIIFFSSSLCQFPNISRQRFASCEVLQSCDANPVRSCAETFSKRFYECHCVMKDTILIGSAVCVCACATARMFVLCLCSFFKKQNTCIRFYHKTSGKVIVIYNLFLICICILSIIFELGINISLWYFKC